MVSNVNGKVTPVRARPAPRKDRARITPSVARNAEKDMQALELRAQGATYAQIAAALGDTNKKIAWDRVLRAYKTLAPAAGEDAREAELARLQMLEDAMWPAAMKGDVRSAEGVLRVIQTRCVLLGIREPARVQIDVDVERHVDEAWAKTQELIRANPELYALPASGPE